MGTSVSPCFWATKKRYSRTDSDRTPSWVWNRWGDLRRLGGRPAPAEAGPGGCREGAIATSWTAIHRPIETARHVTGCRVTQESRGFY